MKLKKLEITGFKSFNQKTAIDFPQGVSAIVGPNGCGKSNVIDALRWVMGEQSVKQLRGKSMEDIIFAGANSQPPLNMAEVSLTLLNDNGSAPEEFKDYSEIMLTRRLYRSGESAYFINKQPCRLKDIVNVFLGSGMGAKSYAVIQQGNIGAIIDAGPEERRYYLEEAAGTTRFKHRKMETLRKVGSTNQNLMRISDIIGEINRQMQGLKRQARKAERYKTYQERLHQLDVQFMLHSYDRLTRQIDRTDAVLRELKDQDLSHSTNIKKLDAAVEEIKLQRFQKNQEISEQKSLRFETVRNTDKLEANHAHLNQEIQRLDREIQEMTASREDLLQKRSQIQTEIENARAELSRASQQIRTTRDRIERKRSAADAVKSRFNDLNTALDQAKSNFAELTSQEAQYRHIYQNASTSKDSVNRRLKRLEDEALEARKTFAAAQTRRERVETRLDDIRRELSSLNEQLETLYQRRNDSSQALSRQVKAVQTLEIERTEVRSRLAALQKMEDNLEWYKDGVRAILKACDGHNRSEDHAEGPQSIEPDAVLGLVADILEPAPSFETAVEAVLNDSLQYVLVNDQQTGMDAISYLDHHNAGRSGFIPVAGIKPSIDPAAAAMSPANRLLNHITVKPGFEEIAEALLGHVMVVDNYREATELYNQNGFTKTIVTKNGNVIACPGIMIGGSQNVMSGILVKKKELKQLAQQMTLLNERVEDAQKTQSALEFEVRRVDSDIQKRIEQKKNEEQNDIAAEKDLLKLSEEMKHLQRHLEINQLEQEQLLGEKSEIDDEMAKYHSALADIQLNIAAAQKDVAEKSEQTDTLATEMESFNQQIVELKLDLTATETRQANVASNLKRLQEFEIEGQNAIERLSADLTQKQRHLEEAREQVQDNQAQLRVLYATLQELDTTLANIETDYQAIDAQLQESDSQKSNIQSERDKLLDKLRLLELEQSQRQVKRDHIVDRIQEQYHQPFGHYADQLKSISSESQSVDLEALQSEIDQLKKRMLNIGDVNLGAINEYEQLKARHDFLCEQREDLQKAIDNLHAVIKKINRITEERFLATFESVNEKLKDVFPKLFEGGTAKMVLTDPNDPLESGVEYMIHPPGKKLTRMSLLSGGEKALAAIAFVFSLFLLKPASFCLMDEIDAPLDDANTFRFNDLLKMIGEKSQIIVVTHNKRTMEFADMLFGITMETKGISKVVSVNFEQNQTGPSHGQKVA